MLSLNLNYKHRKEEDSFISKDGVKAAKLSTTDSHDQSVHGAVWKQGRR